MLVTKRGTNQWHGSGYDYFQADWLNAAGWDTDIEGTQKVKQDQNRFGGALGGPLPLKSFLGGKTYIYGNYEGLRGIGLDPTISQLWSKYEPRPTIALPEAVVCYVTGRPENENGNSGSESTPQHFVSGKCQRGGRLGRAKPAQRLRRTAKTSRTTTAKGPARFAVDTTGQEGWAFGLRGSSKRKFRTKPSGR